jgi:hypothetical protein
MDSNWPYVVAGYGLTIGVLSTYVVWLQRKLTRARRSLPEDER